MGKQSIQLMVEKHGVKPHRKDSMDNKRNGILIDKT